MASTKIIIKIIDPLFLHEPTYQANKDQFKIGPGFFSPLNLTNLSLIYPNINTSGNIIESRLVFQKLINNLLAIDPLLKLESLYSVIDSSLPVKLMKMALDESAYVGSNLLNYYFIEVDNAVLKLRYDQLVSLKKIPGSGIEIVHVRASLADFNATSSSLFDNNIKHISATKLKGIKVFEGDNSLKSIKKSESETAEPSKSVNRIGAVATNVSIVNDFFQNCGIVYSNSTNGIKIIDIEQGWRPASVSGLSINGGGYNYHSSSPKAKHGTNTQNVLHKIPSNPSYLSGLCQNAPRVVSSTWFGPPLDERREAALVATLATVGVVSKSDVILLELQVSLAGGYLPVEIEDPMFQAIKTAINAKYIIIEAAGNGGYNLNTYNYSSWMSSAGIINLSTNNSGAIMVGAATNPMPTINTCNHGTRVNYYCFGNLVPTASGISYSSTSLASAIMAALVVHLQSKAKQLKSRTMKNAELKGLLNIIFPSKVPTSTNVLSNVNAYISGLS